jgi:hypothetical protein
LEEALKWQVGKMRAAGLALVDDEPMKSLELKPITAEAVQIAMV